MDLDQILDFADKGSNPLGPTASAEDTKMQKECYVQFI